MKTYTYCAVGSVKTGNTCTAFGIGNFETEGDARIYLIDDFFKNNEVYPEHVQIAVVSRRCNSLRIFPVFLSFRSSVFK